MPDLDRELTAGLRATPDYTRPAEELLPEFRHRMARRRQRRMATAGVGVVLLIVAGANLVGRSGDREAEPMAPSPTSTTEAPAVFDPAIGPALEPHDVEVPAEGIAVDVPEVGVVLVGLDGRVHGHLPGFNLDTEEGSSGPQLLRRDDEWFRLDEGRLRKATRDDIFVNVPLAYGAELASAKGYIPGRRVVRRQGQDLLNLGNGMDTSGWVSHDRDVVTREDETATRALDLRTGRTSDLPARCFVADRHGRRRYLSCGDGIRAGDESDAAPPPLHGRPGGDGYWKKVMASPDGSRLLLEWWTRECGQRRAFLRPAGDGPASATALFGDTPTAAYGWSADGRAVVLAGAAASWETGCEMDYPEAGVYLVGVDGSKALVYPGRGLRLALWSSALREP